MKQASPDQSRELRLAQIKSEIAAGSYDTEEKMEAALENFLDQWEDRQWEGQGNSTRSKSN